MVTFLSGVREERTLIINLANVREYPRHKRTEKIVRTLRDNLARIFKVKIEYVKLDKSLNNIIWSRGGRNSLSKLKVKVTLNEDGVLLAKLPEAEKEENKTADTIKQTTVLTSENTQPISEEKPKEKVTNL